MVNLNDTIDYSGTTVNLAARIEGQAEGGEVALSAEFLSSRKVRAALQRMGVRALRTRSQRLKGIAEETRVYTFPCCRTLLRRSIAEFRFFFRRVSKAVETKTSTSKTRIRRHWMQYLLLMYDDEKRAEGYGEDEMEKWFAVTGEMKSAGAMLGGEALKPSETATTVRMNGNSFVTTDGPFAETKEQLGGYYVIDVKDIDEAIAWARKMPHVPKGGSVEIRPIMKFDA